MTSARYQQHLDRVSRSFAFCIAELPEPLRAWTGLSYLLCRVLDTVEDTSWPSGAVRQLQYDGLESFLGQPPAAATMTAWAARFDDALPAGELLLVADAASLFRDLAALPEPVGDLVRRTVRHMSAGMRHYSRRQEPDGILRIGDLPDLNRYCFFVAGTVGHLLSNLYRALRPQFRPPSSWSKNALHFGLFLQKVNILKDQREDEGSRRFLVPERRQVVASLADNAAGAMAYLAALPAEETGFRRFCAWSLFLGAASLPHVEASWQRGDDSRISRGETARLLADVADIVADNEALASRLAALMAQAAAARGDDGPLRRRPRHPAPAAQEVPWFTQLATTLMASPPAPAELAELGMV